ncbi:MAG: DUF3179 domain-containing (seleno)protein [Acidimicrobiia bacterium]
MPREDTRRLGGDDERLPPKERVVYLEEGDGAAAVPFSLLEEKRTVDVKVGGRALAVVWEPEPRRPSTTARSSRVGTSAPSP